MDFAKKEVRNPKLTKQGLDQIVDTILAAHWAPDAVRTVGSEVINHFLQDLRETSISTVTYAAVRDTLVGPIRKDAPSQVTWNLWTELTQKYNIQKTVSAVQLIETITKLDTGTIHFPLDLADISKKEALALDSAMQTGWIATLLWQCVKCHFEYPTQTNLQRFNRDPEVVNILLGKIRGKRIENTETYKKYLEIRTQLGLPPEFDRLTPGAKVKTLAKAKGRTDLVTQFLTLGAEVNLLRTVKCSLPQVRSGVNSYVRMCNLLARPPFPPTENTAQLRSATFNPGKTFNQYLAHLQKASLLLNRSLEWLTPVIRGISKGLKNAQDLSFKFPNFIESKDILTVLEFVKLDSVTGQSYYLSYLFGLRVPSETLRLTRAFRDDRITEFAPQTDKALIGTRKYNDTTVLVIKFSFRENIRNGCILMRPCLCGASSRTANDLCPVHKVWPRIADRDNAGDPLFPDLTANTSNRQLKATMTAMGFDRGGDVFPPRLSAGRYRRN